MNLPFAVEVHRSIQPLAREWDDLADRARASPFSRPGWMAAWWNAFGTGQLEIVAVRRAGCLVAVAPLHRSYGALRSLSNAHTPVFGFVADGDAAAEQLTRAVVARPVGHVVLAFLDPADAGVAQYVDEAVRAGQRTLVRRTRSPYVSLGGDWDAYQRRLGKKRRADLRRCRRRLEELGRVTIDVSDGVASLDAPLTEGFAIEGSGWKDARGTAIRSRADTCRFYTDVARWAARRGWLRLSFLRLDGRAVAFDYGIEQGGIYYLLKTGYDHAYRCLGPGFLLRQEMLHWAHVSALTRYELLGVDDPWKLEWTNHWNERWLLHAFRPSLLRSLEWAAWSYGRPAARRVQRRVHRLVSGVGRR